MSAKRMTLFAVAAALLIAAAVFVGIYFSGGGDTAAVILPETSESGAPEETLAPEETSGVVSAELTPETVQAAIGTLVRPASYHRTLATELFWSGGSSSSTAEVWVRGGLTRIDLTENGAVKHLIVTGAAIYIWYDDDTEYFTAVPAEGESAAVLADRLSSIPGYETVLSLDTRDITDAGYVQRAGADCIFVRTSGPDGGYSEEYYIALDSGLLIEAATYDGETAVYTMKAGAAELTAPEDALFCLPGEDTPVIS